MNLSYDKGAAFVKQNWAFNGNGKNCGKSAAFSNTLEVTADYSEHPRLKKTPGCCTGCQIYAVVFDFALSE